MAGFRGRATQFNANPPYDDDYSDPFPQYSFSPSLRHELAIPMILKVTYDFVINAYSPAMMLWSVILKNELFMFLGVGIFQLMLTYGRQIAEWFTISALVAGGNAMDS